MNRKLLVVFLIVLAVAPVSALLATGILSPDASSSNTAYTLTSNTAPGLTAVVSTTLQPRTHQHYKVDLSVSLGDCVNPYGRPC